MVILDPYFSFFLLFAYILGAWPDVTSSIHVLQLFGYKNKPYIQWLREERFRAVKLTPITILIMVLVVLIISLIYWDLTSPSDGFGTLGRQVFFANFVGPEFCSLGFFMIFFFRKREDHKKKLVFTSRVQRLILFYFVFLFLFSLLVAILVDSLLISFLLFSVIILGTFSPWLIAITNYLIQPLEDAIQRYYYNDAEKVLTSCSSLLKIGITGSYGKTSTKFILQQCLSAEYNSSNTRCSNC